MDKLLKGMLMPLEENRLSINEVKEMWDEIKSEQTLPIVGSIILSKNPSREFLSMNFSGEGMNQQRNIEGSKIEKAFLEIEYLSRNQPLSRLTIVEFGEYLMQYCNNLSIYNRLILNLSSIMESRHLNIQNNDYILWMNTLLESYFLKVSFITNLLKSDEEMSSLISGWSAKIKNENLGVLYGEFQKTLEALKQLKRDFYEKTYSFNVIMDYMLNVNDEIKEREFEIELSRLYNFCLENVNIYNNNCLDNVFCFFWCLHYLRVMNGEFFTKPRQSQKLDIKSFKDNYKRFSREKVIKIISESR